MLFANHMKNRKKLKIMLLLMVVASLVVTFLVLSPTATRHGSGDSRQRDGTPMEQSAKLEQAPVVRSSVRQNGLIQPEKYDEHKVKARIIQEKIKELKEHQQQQQQQQQHDSDEEHTPLESVTSAVHIFYSAPVQWYKTKKPTKRTASKEPLRANGTTVPATRKPALVRTLNTAFYPALGLYKPTATLLRKHFENIRNCGIGVLILGYTGRSSEAAELYRRIIALAPNYNLSVTFELSVAGNQSEAYLRQQLLDVSSFMSAPGFYRIYSHSRKAQLPLLYLSNAYKLLDTPAAQLFCANRTRNSLRLIVDAYFIGHIRLKGHAEAMRRLCLEGFYSKLPSNGATFASTWKNWSYLKSFALTYRMLFVPTVGPGFAERNKFPRHGDIQRHRSNGRYYGVAWRTAILNHVGFINLASYNNWPDGSQIEEVIPKAGFLDYSPGTPRKYLDLTTHWVGAFLKNRLESHSSCYEYLNNSIC